MARVSQFASVPHSFKGAVYTAELSNGMVKVGYSRNPRTRLDTLNHWCKRRFRAAIVRYHIGVDVGDMVARRVEMALIDRLSRRANQVKGHREFFTDARFPDVVNLVRQMSAQGALADVGPA